MQPAPAQRPTSSNKEQVGVGCVLALTCKRYFLQPQMFTLIRIFSQACNVLYLNSVETECLTGPEAVSKATKCTLSLNPRPAATVVHFKVSAQGITLTDNKRRYNIGYFICLVPLLCLLSSPASFLIKLN